MPLLSTLAVCIKQKSCRPALIYLKREKDRGLRQMRVQECCCPGPRARGRRLASAWARDLDRAALLAGSGGRPAVHGLLSRLRKENSPDSRAGRTAAAATSSMGRSRMKPPLSAVSPERQATEITKPHPHVHGLLHMVWLDNRSAAAIFPALRLIGSAGINSRASRRRITDVAASCP